MEFSLYPVRLSLIVSSFATIISVLFGLVVTYWMTQGKGRGKMIFETIFFLPIVLPPTVIGFLLIVIFGKNSPIGKTIEWITGSTVLFTVPAAIIAASVVSFPLIYQSMKTGFLSVDQTVIAAAKVDGASNFQLFIYHFIPLSWRSILSGIILGFTRALGEFGATLMFAGNIPGRTQTIPTAIYFFIESGNWTIATYYVMISILFSFLFLLLANRMKSIQ
ncbi:molybdate ABC transporter permease subunit [Fervidibacillus albus]|uniref:Molybdenum transport system permease n=1 Tax=Fervidibacillus albus TaxID=2980026 RepID=A0A9E8LTI0_9BACI|nr:molybdate ABC transporter permease subunit [Fervidibacillus albus]WAA09343.1 molybdate ABC transporter permease subunit [Fervidibacillus albus]